MSAVMSQPASDLHAGTVRSLSQLEVPADRGGVVLGHDRSHAPVAAQLFRPESTNLVLVGSLRLAQIVAFRSLAVGAHVVVQTARPRGWEPLHRALGGVGIEMAYPGGQLPSPPTGPSKPQLVVMDVGQPMNMSTLAPVPWRSTLLVREEITQWDLDSLFRADLVLMQTLSSAEATLAATALGVPGAESVLSTIRPSLVTLASRGQMSWAKVNPTPIEQQLIGAPNRS